MFMIHTKNYFFDKFYQIKYKFLSIHSNETWSRHLVEKYLRVTDIVLFSFRNNLSLSYKLQNWGQIMSSFLLNLGAPICSIACKAINLGSLKLILSTMKHLRRFHLMTGSVFQNIQYWAKYEHMKLNNSSISAQQFTDFLLFGDNNLH